VKGSGTATVQTNVSEIKHTNVKYMHIDYEEESHLQLVRSIITDNGNLVIFFDLCCGIFDKRNHQHTIAIGH